MRAVSGVARMTPARSRQSLDDRARAMLDEWVIWRELDELEPGRPRSAWDGVAMSHAKSEAAATYRRGRQTVHAVETRPSGHSRIPEGVDAMRYYNRRMLRTDGLMTLVADQGQEYWQAVRLKHTRGVTERDAAESLGIARATFRERYAVGFALFLRELSA